MTTQKKSQILVIDDDQEFLDLFRSRLFRWNIDYDIEAKKTSVDMREANLNPFIGEVCELISANRDCFAAIFLDLALTGGEKEEAIAFGFRLGKSLRDEFYEIPILVLTQHGEKEILSRGYFYDFDGYIEKSHFSTMSSESFTGHLFRAIEKRKAIVENLPRYCERHLERSGSKLSFSFLSAFDNSFAFKGNNLEKTLISAINFENYLNSIERVTVILFADLVGSAEIKQASGIFEGLAITRFHNEVVTKFVKNSGGAVVKYIGDCVMARYDYENDRILDCNCINAAIDIQEYLSVHNKSSGRKRPIQTKIGIASGKVADFYGNDPQGECVDLAARLQSKAKPAQILVSKEFIDMVQASHIESEVGKAKHFTVSEYVVGPHALTVKGFSKEVDVYEINWSGDSVGFE